jgi:tRNA-2-methylthio-N6-dimethylallyladenosine synthase
MAQNDHVAAARGVTMRFHIRTYGCQMNVRDSDAAAAMLVREGHRQVDEAEADVVLVNTCSVRGKAEDKALGKLGLLVAARRVRPGLRVGALGCMVQRLGGTLLDRVPGLDLAVGPRALPRLPALLERVCAGEGPCIDVGEAEDGPEALAAHAGAAVSDFVTILLGCERRCAYCIVPDVRGREWSRPAERVLAEIRALAETGCREVTLLGQSVMAYGLRNTVWPEGVRSPRGYTEPMPRLLEAIETVPGIVRVRFTSGHPSGCTPELARAMAELPHVCAHLHLPVQSGSDRVLRRMGRGYTADGYRAAVATLRAETPDLALTTDVIVGFPGETEEDFALTRGLMDEIGFDNAFVFKYSPRPGTRAAEWEDDIPDAEKRRRNAVLLEDQDRRGLAIRRAQAGRAVEVLAEGPSPRNPERWHGRTGENRIVLFEPAAGVKPGRLVRVRIERAAPQTLYGCIEALCDTKTSTS